MSSQREDLKNLIITHQRSLQILQEQKATFGLHAPPHILLQIEDTQAKIAALQEELQTSEAIIYSNPYRGLSAFQEEHANYFFGRESFIAQLVESISRSKFWKSSLTKIG